MEADWEIEIGQEAPIQQALIQQAPVQEAPIIDACWPGLVDLRTDPERVRELPEVRQLPALADALVRLNATDSPVWTAKCDVWPVAEPCAEFDRFELDSPVEAAVHVLACYIDLLPVSEWVLPEKAIASCENLCARLRSVPLRCCRVDLVIRRAVVVADRQNLGITAYLIACGSTEAGAAAQLESALAVLGDSVLAEESPAPARSKLQ